MQNFFSMFVWTVFRMNFHANNFPSKKNLWRTSYLWNFNAVHSQLFFSLLLLSSIYFTPVFKLLLMDYEWLLTIMAPFLFTPVIHFHFELTYILFQHRWIEKFFLWIVEVVSIARFFHPLVLIEDLRLWDYIDVLKTLAIFWDKEPPIPLGAFC